MMINCLVNPDSLSVYIYDDFTVVFAASPVRRDYFRRERDGFISMYNPRSDMIPPHIEMVGDAGYIIVGNWEVKAGTLSVELARFKCDLFGQRCTYSLPIHVPLNNGARRGKPTPPPKPLGQTEGASTMTEVKTDSFKFDGLTVEDADFPRSVSGPNPLTPQIEKSASKRTTRPDGTWVGLGRKITVPHTAVPQVVNAVRDAAEQLGHGSRINLSDEAGKPLNLASVGGKPGKPNAAGKTRMTGGKLVVQTEAGKAHTGPVVVVFAAKTPRQTAKRKAASTPAASAE